MTEITSNRRIFFKKAVSGSSIVAGLSLSELSKGRAQGQTSSSKTGMAYRNLGSTGYKVGEISMGCMNTRDPELVHAAIDSGINYIDTAYIYMNGQNEEIIGQVMKTRRDKV